MRLGLSLAAVSLAASLSLAGPGCSEPEEDDTFVPPAPTVSKTIFLNRCEGGCTIMPGQNNSRTNHSTIVNGTSVLTEFGVGFIAQRDQVWADVVSCVQDMYAPYDVRVTDVDPGDTEPHHEAIVAGQAAEIGAGDGVGGLGLGGCNLVDNAMSFTFDVWGPNALTICAVVAQESAHTYGLDHELDCSTPMTYLPACGRQFFRDKNIPCGEFEERNCACGATVQNSHRWLLGQLGPNENQPPGPTTTMMSPMDGATVTPGFPVTIEATDLRSIGKVEFWVNGTLYHELEGNGNSTYTWLTPADTSELANGVLDIEVKAYNSISIETTVTATVTKGAPCQTAETDCNAQQICDEGRCITQTKALGESCTEGAECDSGLCPLEGSSGFCSQNCDPNSALMECPEGMSCRTTGNGGVCWPESAGGCSTTGGAGGLGGLLFALGFIALVRRRRR